MWQILKAELRYNKLVVLFVILYPFLGVLPSKIGSYLMIHGIIGPHGRAIIFLFTVSSILFSFIIAFEIIKEPDEKRDRLYKLLPISTGRIGYSRFFFPFFIWMGLIMVSIFSQLLSPHHGLEMKRIFGLFTINSFFITIYALKCINRDLQFLFGKEYVFLKSYGISIANILVSLSAAFIGWFHFMMAYNYFYGVLHSKAFMPKLMFSLHGAIIFNLICFGFIYLSVWLFTRRRTYLR